MHVVPSVRSVPTVTEIAARVREEYLRPTNGFGPDFFTQHTEVAVQRGLALAPKLGADPLVVALAGYLHDLAVVRDMATLPVHDREGARLARELLTGWGFSAAVADGVARAAGTHSTPLRPGEGTPEQVCIAAADVLSHLARPAWWCFYLYKVRGFEYAQGLDWLRGRVRLYEEALVPEAQALGAEDHAAMVRWLAGAE